MTRHYGQYPDIYSTDDTRYTFYYDSGERVTLIAGENGVTQEWIHALRLEHRSEYNMLRRGLRTRSLDSVRTLSLDQYIEEVGDAGKSLCDETADVESNYIACLDAAEKRARILEALNSLSVEHRDLLIRVRVKGDPITTIAREQGVDESAVRRRITRIEKRIKNFFS